MKQTARIACVLMCLLIAFTIGYSQEPLVLLTIDQAAAKGDLVNVKRELQKGGDVNGAHAGTSLLSLATKNGRLDMVKFLVEKGADVNARGNDGETPLTLATKQDVVDFLKQHGAKIQTPVNYAP